ncbi:linear amide C-N hydrolase [Enterobacteriaceae bacterium LUAb1]
MLRLDRFSGAFLPLLMTLVCLVVSYPGQSCTRILWNSGETGVLVGRTMDWPESTQPVLMLLPRGIAHNGSVPGNAHAVEHPVHWTSVYASLVTGIYGVGSVDGFNEKGLGAHLHTLENPPF